MQLKQAQQIAIELCYKLQPYCEPERINIAGSVRRKKPEVKDIEIVCVPKIIQYNDLFGVPSVRTVSREFIEVAEGLGTIIKGKGIGRYMQIQLSEGVKLDLFMPGPEDYFRQYAIRTGSADYSSRIIAGGWKKLGWCGSDLGLRKISDCVEMKTPDGKSKWKCVNKNAEKPPYWKSEIEFFKWLKVPYVKPENRYI